MMFQIRLENRTHAGTGTCKLPVSPSLEYPP